MRKKDVWWTSILLFTFILLGNALGYWNVAQFFPGWWTLFILLPYVYHVFVSGLDVHTTIGLSLGFLCLAADLKYYSYTIGCYISLILILVIVILKGVNMYRHKNK